MESKAPRSRGGGGSEDQGHVRTTVTRDHGCVKLDLSVSQLTRVDLGGQSWIVQA